MQSACAFNIFICGLNGHKYQIFQRYVTKTRFSGVEGGGSYWTQNCFDFHYNVCLKHFSFKMNSARYCHKCIHVFMQSNRHSCQILIKLIVSTDFPKKISQVTFHLKNPSDWSRAVPCKRTWRNQKSLFPILRTRLKMTKAEFSGITNIR
jgi:hypothetical protein